MILLDKPKAQVLLTVSSIDLMKYPDPLVAMAKLLNAAGVDSTMRTKGHVAWNQPVMPGLLFIGPTSRQLRKRGDLIIDNGLITHGRANDPVAAAFQQADQAF